MKTLIVAQLKTFGRDGLVVVVSLLLLPFWLVCIYESHVHNWLRLGFWAAICFYGTRAVLRRLHEPTPDDDVPQIDGDDDFVYVPSSEWCDELSDGPTHVQEQEANHSAGVSRRRLYFYALLKPSGHERRIDWFEAASLEEAVAKAHERHGDRVLSVSPEIKHSPDAAKVLSALIAAASDEAEEAMAATDCEHGCRVEGVGSCPHGFQSAARTLGLI